MTKIILPNAAGKAPEPMPVGSLVFFHHPCADGFTAAWAAWRMHPSWEYVGVTHTDFPSLLPADAGASWLGEDIYFLDICPPRDVLQRVCDMVHVRNRKVYVIDHHKSAMAMLETFEHEALERRVTVERSGAGLAWEFFHANEHGETPHSELVKLVEDRDLWRFEYADTKAFSAFLFSMEYNFETWNDIHEALQGEESREVILSQGDAIERKHAKDVAELVANGFDWQIIGGWQVPVLNVPYFYASEAGHELCKGKPFAATWYEREGRRYYSLRSEEGVGVDVSEIARYFGGGGHKHAAGFNIISEAGDVILRNLEDYMLPEFKEPQA